MACICPNIRVEDSSHIQNEVWLEVTHQYDIIIWSLLGLVCMLLVVVISLVVYILRKIETRTHCQVHLPLQKDCGTSPHLQLRGLNPYPMGKYSPRPSTCPQTTTLELTEWNNDDRHTPPPVID